MMPESSPSPSPGHGFIGIADERVLEPFLNNAELRVLAAIRHGANSSRLISQMIGMPRQRALLYARRLEQKGLIRIHSGYQHPIELRGSWRDVIQQIRNLVKAHHLHVMQALTDYEESTMPPAWRRNMGKKSRPHGVQRAKESFVEAKPRDW